MTLTEFYTTFGRCTSSGWLDCEEAILLALAAEETTGPMVEIGSYQGRSAMLLGQLCGRLEDSKSWGPRTLYCVDPWDDRFHSDLKGDEILRRFMANIASLPNGGTNITAVRCQVEHWQPIPAQFIYCDGDHTYAGTIVQIQKALQCNPRVIAIHDVNDEGGGRQIKEAALELLGPWSERALRLAVWRLP